MLHITCLPRPMRGRVVQTQQKRYPITTTLTYKFHSLLAKQIGQIHFGLDMLAIAKECSRTLVVGVTQVICPSIANTPMVLVSTFYTSETRPIAQLPFTDE